MNLEPDKAAPNYVGETPEMLAAFEAYLKMGNGRSVGKLAKALKKSKPTLENWSRRMEWRLRVASWQEEEAERAKEKMKQDFFKDAENMRTFKYTVLNELKKRFEVGHYCPECETPRLSVNEMISILNVAKTELNEPTNITKNTAINPDNDPFVMILSRMYPPPANADAKPD